MFGIAHFKCKDWSRPHTLLQDYPITFLQKAFWDSFKHGRAWGTMILKCRKQPHAGGQLKRTVRRGALGVLQVAETWFHLLSAELSTVIHCLQANTKHLENLRFPWASGVSWECEQTLDRSSRNLSTLWTLCASNTLIIRLPSALHLFVHFFSSSPWL